MVNCVIIDDEALTRDLLKSYIDKLDCLSLINTFESPLQSLNTLKYKKIDIIFLDIHIARLNDVDFVEFIPSGISIVFISAFPKYTVKGFELFNVDYLLKPITFEHFLISLLKIKTISSKSVSEVLIIKSGYKLHRIKAEDVLFIESDSEYVIYHTKDKRIMSNQALKSLESDLDSTIFMRVHRSYIVNKDKVEFVENKNIVISGNNIPVSLTYYEKVKDVLFSD